MARRTVVVAVSLAVALLGVLYSPPVEAQKTTLSAGPKLGFNIATILGPEEQIDAERQAFFGLVAGAHIVWNPTPILGVQPEILYTVKGDERSVRSDGQETLRRVRHNYLEFPLLLRLNMPLPKIVPLTPKLLVGPAFSFWLDGQREVEAPTSEESVVRDLDAADDGIRPFDFGIVVGVGTDVNLGLFNITFDVRFLRGLLSIVDNPPDDAPQHSQIAFHGGLAIGY